VQNLSANKIYFLTSTSEGTSHGIEISPNEAFAKDNWRYDIILVADGANSDVRIITQTHEVYNA